MQKHILPADAETRKGSGKATPIRVTFVTLDNHMTSAIDRARATLHREIPGLELTVHALAGWGEDQTAAERCRADIETADIIVASMIFLDDHSRAIRPALEARRDHCDCVVGCLSGAEIVKLTRIGDFNMSKPTTGVLGLLKRLRGGSKGSSGAGHGQMKVLRTIPKILKFIPGKAQDVRAYFLTLQYLLAGSDENLTNLVRFLISRYASGPRAGLRKRVKPADPVNYPDTGLYHPVLKERVTDDLAAFSRKVCAKSATGTVGLLVMRSYVLAGNTAHYDGVISALEARGLKVVPAFASGLDARPAIERFFLKDGQAIVDAVVSLTGFSLVGGPAYNDAPAAEAMLAELDVPYLSAFAIEFQTLEQWLDSDLGLSPVETTMMVALPEMDGASGSLIFGGRSGAAEIKSERDMVCKPDRAERLAARVEKLIRLRRSAKKDRRVAIVIYNFPPNGGAVGTAAYLSVFRSLFNTLKAMKAEGYTVDLPESVDALRDRILIGNSERHGTAANVLHRVPAETHVAREKYLAEIEAQWGPAPGRHQTDGSGIFVLGADFGNVIVGVQPAFGYEGDPMRLLFEKTFTPTHAFAAFYTYLKTDFAADAVLHFGTHGALEFMPGKQVGLSDACWPERLIGALPNYYLYAANNPSEGIIARRRSAATLVSYLTPPLSHAGLYKGLLDLKASVERWRALPPGQDGERRKLAEIIQSQAATVDLAEQEAEWSEGGEAEVPGIYERIIELETTLIPHGLHVVGEVPTDLERRDLLAATNEAMMEGRLSDADIDAIVTGERVAIARGEEQKAMTVERLARLNEGLQVDHETGALLRALDTRYIHPVAGGDIVRAPEIVPTGRNLHGFDPFRLPTAYAVEDGREQADRLIERHIRDSGQMPKSIALVLWGSDNLKTEGSTLSQALALIGAKPRFDGFGRLAGAELIPLEDLGRPRIDVVITLSGIFRDLLPMQTKLLAEACNLAATADEPVEKNFLRKHALEYAAKHECSLDEAALRVFSNAAGAYGSNVNMLIDSGAWDDEDEIAETYTSRKCFAYGVDGKPVKRQELLGEVLQSVDAAYQNLESVELGITTIDHYFDTLGGISRAIRKSGGGHVPVYVGDQTCGKGKVRTLTEQVALETRSRMLNPKWYEGLLKHGYEGVRQIESHVTNTLGWSATTGQVAPWVYKNLTETFILDEEMRTRMADLNPKACSKLANRLIEAHERNYWQPDEATLEALRAAGDELEDRLEGIDVEAA